MSPSFSLHRTVDPTPSTQPSRTQEASRSRSIARRHQEYCGNAAVSQTRRWPPSPTTRPSDMEPQCILNQWTEWTVTGGCATHALTKPSRRSLCKKRKGSDFFLSFLSLSLSLLSLPITVGATSLLEKRLASTPCCSPFTSDPSTFSLAQPNADARRK